MPQGHYGPIKVPDGPPDTRFLFLSDVLPTAWFDKQIGVHMGQANVKRWVPDILPLLGDDDPLGTADLTTHELPLSAAPDAYELQHKRDGCLKVVLRP